MKRMTLRIVALMALAIGLIGFSGITTAQNQATPEGSPAAGSGMGGHGMGGHGMGGTGAAYFMIENKGSEADRLIAAAADVADVVEIHEIVDNNGVKEMRPLADGLAIPAGETVTLAPGGYHIMLIGLTQDLTGGMTYDLTLTFEKAGDVVVQAPIQRAAPEGDAIVSTEVGDLTISGVWSRPAPALMAGGTPEGSPMAGSGMGGQGMGGHVMGGTGAAYFMIENQGSEADRLIAAAADVADVVEIHEIVDNNGVKEMRPLADGLAIPAGESVMLAPGGYHVMLIGLTGDLTEGMTFDLTLTFEKAGDVIIPVTVQRAAPEGDAIVSIEAGDLTITGVWSRPAPALLMDGTPEASPEASPTM